MRRSSVRLSLALLMALGIKLGIGVAFAGDDKCTIATKGDSPTAKACAEGGRTKAKATMKEMVKVAKGNGTKFTCENCHKDMDNFELTKNAKDDFAKLVAAQKK